MGGGGASDRVELRQPIERLIVDTLRGPIRSHPTKIVIEATVFLGEDDDVVNLTDTGGRWIARSPGNAKPSTTCKEYQ